MQTLMSDQSFSELKIIRDRIIKDRSSDQTNDLSEVAGIFVPWAGSQLLSGGGIYYIGIATAGEFGDGGPQTFDACYNVTAEMCNGQRHDKSYFWRFLDGLTKKLFGGPYEKTVNQWGWSNLLKIGYAKKESPDRWPSWITRPQFSACVECLREELSQLQKTVIFLAYDGVFVNEVFLPALGQKDQERWSKDENARGISWWKDEDRQNLYLHGYHPHYAWRNGFFDAQLDCTAEPAGRHLKVST